MDNYEDGEVVDHEGEWIAGEGDAQVGVFLPPDPQVGDEFEQERAPDVAEDISTVVDTGVAVVSRSATTRAAWKPRTWTRCRTTRGPSTSSTARTWVSCRVSPEGDTLDLVSLETG